ncbi:DUF4352 domain-containing protein [Streptomyces sp. NPDC020875]|uniref:DUF4352 domain-containing protein n=1 Tax=Streptomyces sp. NPDC020875 TaxID=3154898 RepID=UPI0033C3EC76
MSHSMQQPPYGGGTGDTPHGRSPDGPGGYEYGTPAQGSPAQGNPAHSGPDWEPGVTRPAGGYGGPADHGHGNDYGSGYGNDNGFGTGHGGGGAGGGFGAEGPGGAGGPAGPGGGGRGPLRNGLGTAALVLGLIGAAVAWIPFVFFVGGALGLTALIMGLKGRGRARRGEASNGRAAAAGAAIGAGAMVLATVGTYLTVQITSDAVDEVTKDIASSGAPSTDQGDGGEGDGSGLGGDKKSKDKKGKKGKGKGLGGGGDTGGQEGPLAAGGSATYPDGIKVTVTKAPQSFRPGDYAAGHEAGNKAYKVTVVIENMGDKRFDSTLTTTEARAGTEGVTAEQIFDDTVDTGFEGTILPGRKATTVYGFSTPATAKELTLEISPGMSHDPAQWELAL